MLKFLFNHRKNNNSNKKFTSSQPIGPTPTISLSEIVKKNTEAIKQLLHNPNDLVIREFNVGTTHHACALVCLDGLVDKYLINDQVLKPLLHYLADHAQASGAALFETMAHEVLSAFELKQVSSFDDVILAILSGETAIFVEEVLQVFIVDSKGWKSRTIEEPQTEATIRGPREGFTEDIRTNTALVRRRIRDTHLRFESFVIGTRSKKDVFLVYLDGIVHPELIKEARRRLNSIHIDDIEGSSQIEHWITDSYLSPFPIIQNTERPDKVTGALIQGKLAILVDGDPFVLVFPIAFISNIHSPEDYYQNWLISTSTRVLRMIGAFIATFLPALYIALVEYHHGMIPSKLAFSIAGAREGVPFPAVVEAFIMEFTLELLREAGLRLPKPIGQTIGIVGGLVIGEAAVSAGIVSPIMVIVVAITAISSFALPSYSFAISIRMIRFGVMLAAALFGLYGIILSYIIINIHFVSLTSFGVPYSTPFAPLFIKDWKDLILRVPTLFMTKRPQMMQTKDSKRTNKE
jgi:spore germination protein